MMISKTIGKGLFCLASIPVTTAVAVVTAPIAAVEASVKAFTGSDKKHRHHHHKSHK